ncbi:MAG: hypothetical protein IPL35_15655 [Sphingobacteriales bacterium]|nr:hypothetical protein [Sphingobacteriales bacterium]
MFQANQVAKAEQVAQYFADLSLIYQNKGIKKVVAYKKMDCDVVYCSDAEKILQKQNTCFHPLPLQGIS